MRTVPIEFLVTDAERDDLNTKAEDSDCKTRAAWIRTQLNLDEEPSTEMEPPL